MTTRVATVMTAIRTRIAARGLGPGDRLPSIRALAASMAVSPSTVVEAYDRLVAEGVIRARRGAGFHVATAEPAPFRVAAAEPSRDRAVDPFWVSRQSLDTETSASKPGCGWLPADWMPVGALRRALRGLARGADALLTDYGGTRGSPALRRLLAGRFAEEGLAIGPDQILLTGSGTQAIDLVCRFLLRPGDMVLIDDPGYFNFRALLEAHRVGVVGLPYGPAGPDPAAFEAIVASARPRLYITNSALHNPTGATIAPATAHRLLNLAAAHGVTIVEDDIFADFEPDPSPRYAALDGLDRVVRIGSFSKTLSASVRCGYVAARPDWIEGLVDLQVATAFGGPSPVATDLVAAVLAGGGYRKHLDEVRRRLSGARRATAQRLGRLGLVPALMPRGGFYLWCRLPEGLDSAAIARLALAEGHVLAPGNVFSVSNAAAAFLRFNVTQCGAPDLDAVLARAMRTATRSGEPV